MDRMAKEPLRLILGRVPPGPPAPPPNEMTPGDLLTRLALISPDDYRAVIAIARERYKTLWPYPDDVLLLTGTRLR